MTEGLVPAEDLVGILVVVGAVVVDVPIVCFVVNMGLLVNLLNIFFPDDSVVHSPYLTHDTLKELDITKSKLEPELKDDTLSLTRL